MQDDNKPASEGRRDLLKAFATVPLLGAMAYGVYRKSKSDRVKRNIGDVFKLEQTPTSTLRSQADCEKLRIGIIGFGIRGRMLLRACGFAEPELLDTWQDNELNDPKNTRYSEYVDQESLNLEVTGVCDIFDTYAQQAAKAGANINRVGTLGKMGKTPRIYKNYIDMLNAPDIDAVIIATPDQWHGTMAMEAAKRGKHVYLEKPFSWTVEETYEIRKIIRDSGIVFQLGHQGRQTDSYGKAKEIIDKGLLGKVNLIEVCTNRNSPNGAWVYDIHPDANPQTIDWAQFIPPAKRLAEYKKYMKENGLERFMGPDSFETFSLERFFRWRCWWDYGTGLSGDLLTHEYDAINQIMNLGIPHSATSSGGIYHFKDGRTVPDVLQTTFEFPEKDLTLLYSATLASSRNRGKVVMGTDGYLDLGNTLTLYPDRDSQRYKEKIDSGIIIAEEPLYNYVPGSGNIDAITSATEMYFAKRGLLYTYVNGKRYDTTYLHLREFFACIRFKEKPSCNIDEAFDEAITAHMGTRSYLEGRTKYWDKEKEIIA